jgi:hypothetical protein
MIYERSTSNVPDAKSTKKSPLRVCVVDERFVSTKQENNVLTRVIQYCSFFFFFCLFDTGFIVVVPVLVVVVDSFVRRQWRRQR